MKHYILFFIIALTFVSCKDYLDIKPYGKEIPETAEDFSAILHNICDGIDKGTILEGLIIGSYGRSSDFEEITDNMEASISGGNDRLNFYIGTTLSDKQTDFSNLYGVIRYSNIILDNLKEERDSRQGMDIIGTAYAIRGVCYYQLLRQFCAPPLAKDGTLGVPLVTTFDMEAKPIRSTMSETIGQIEEDLKQALTYDIQEPMYLFNNDVINGFLARLYHWCGRWEEARVLATSLLEKHPLLSDDDYKTMMSTQYGLIGNRLIMGNRISDFPQGLSANMQYLQDRPLSVRYTQLFTEGTADIRRKNTFFYNRKRLNKKLIFSGMRSAEMAFIAMECAYHLGDDATALQELNNFRRHRITSYVDYTMSSLPPVDTSELIQTDATGKPLTPLLQAILNERRKEFLLENGDRWFELKRNGRPEWWVAHEGKKYWTRKYMYTWPIPVEDIQQNSGLIQNPGYEDIY